MDTNTTIQENKAARQIDPEKIAALLSELAPEWQREQDEWQERRKRSMEEGSEHSRRMMREDDKRDKELENKNLYEITWAAGDYNDSFDCEATDLGIEINGSVIGWDWIMRQFQRVFTEKEIT